MSIHRAYFDDLINTYFEMGNSALERKEFAIAQKMFKAVFDEPGSKTQKERIMLPLLIKSAESHEGMKQLYKAKLLYIRALALKRRYGKTDMESVQILLTLANLTAQQGLFKQAVDFAVEAHETYKQIGNPDPIDFVRRLRSTERIMQAKGRVAEQARILPMLEEVRAQAMLNLNLPKIVSASHLTQAGFISS